MTTAYEDSDCALYPKTGGGLCHKEETGESDGYWWVETSLMVSTTHGYVRASSWVWKNNRRSMLDFVWNGRNYYRHFPQKAYTARGLVTQAKRFANEVVENNPNNIPPKLIRVFNWLLGCNGSFSPPHNAPKYWWRSELSKKAGLKYDPKLERYIEDPNNATAN